MTYSTSSQAHFAVSKLALALTLFTIACQNLRAQTENGSSWYNHAERRLKAIYDRGEFRPKSIRPNWLADNSGFTLDEVDPNSKQTVRYLYTFNTGERRPVTSDFAYAASSETTKPIRIESRDRQLIAIDPSKQSPTVLASHAPDRDISYSNWSLSPDGAKLLFIQSDDSEVKLRPVLVPSDPSYPEVHQHRFARIGGTIPSLKIGVVNIDGTQLSWLPIDAPAEGYYLGQVEWAGDSDTVLVEKFSRSRDQRDFLLISASSRQTKTIFTETDKAWVEASQGKNSGLHWIQGGEACVIISEKDGWRHAYTYSRDGKELAKLTAGEFDIIDRATIDEKQGWYYFYASPQDGTQKYLYRVPLNGSGSPQLVTPKDQVGTHNYQFSPDAKWAIHTFSTIDSPPSHELIEVNGHRSVRKLEDNQQVRERLQSIETQPVDFLKVDIGNGVTIDAWMIKPKQFDSSKKYPLFIYVYGEPHAQTVLNEWGAAQIDFHRLVAELGYVVVSMDNRGTPCPKGAAWRRSIFGSLGPLSTEEQEAGLKALARRFSFIDLERVGIWGWSGGGSNTLNALFRKPESYQVGIAVVPKPQPHLYNAWFQEIYMRTPEQNPEGYKKSAPINFAEGLKGKLLIMTGSGETNTHIQIIEGLVDKLIALGKPFDYMVYPNRDHGLREGDGTQVHVRMHILRYLLQNLPAGPK